MAPEPTTATMTAEDLIDRLFEAGTGAHKLEPARTWLTGRHAHPLELLNEMASVGAWGPGTVAKAREILEVAGIPAGGADSSAPDSVLGAPDPDPCPPPPFSAPDPLAVVARAEIEELETAIGSTRGEVGELRLRVASLERQSVDFVLAPYVDQVSQKIDELAHRLGEQLKMLQSAESTILELREDVDNLQGTEAPSAAPEGGTPDPQGGPGSIGGATVAGPGG